MLDNLRCTGTEATLFDCPDTGSYVAGCSRTKSAGAVCLCKESDITQNMYCIGPIF